MFGLSTWKIAGIALALAALWLHFESIGSLRDDLAGTQRELAQKEQQFASLEASFDEYQVEVQGTLDRHDEAMSRLARDWQDVRDVTGGMPAILARHDLTRLARQKPGLIQSRINSGTRQVFSELDVQTGSFARGRGNEDRDATPAPEEEEEDEDDQVQ